MKIDSLVKNLERTTAEQDKTMQKQAESVTKRHLASYNELLRSSRNETEQVLAENIKLIKESKSTIQQALTHKTLIGGLMGALLTVMIILIALNAWLGLSLKNKKEELTEITAKIEQSPIEQRLLAKVTVMEWGDEGDVEGIAVTPKTKALWKKDTNGEQTLFIKQ